MGAAGDPGGIKIELREVGGSADGGEHSPGTGVLHRAAAGEADADLLTAAFQSQDRGAGAQLHPFSRKRLAQCRGNAGIGAGNELRAGFEEPDAGPRSVKIEAIWQPVSAPPMTVTSPGRALRVQMSW